MEDNIYILCNVAPCFEVALMQFVEALHTSSRLPLTKSRFWVRLTTIHTIEVAWTEYLT